ncbi:MAG: GNAT family N-acetyltransferase [Clostridia bacterium]|nr:GNAT family N-acetyltransferase [Clostridia bacterium]
MLKFKKFDIEDIEKLKKYISSPARFSCETTFVNLIVWQNMYNNMYAICEDMLFIKSGGVEMETYRLPFGSNLQRGFEILREYTKQEYPPLWVHQGERFIDFKLNYGEHYEFIPDRDAFDYIYLQEDLAKLSGKKYHSKRNHISAFSKQYEWEFKEINQSDISQVLECMNEWYAENSDRFDRHMQCEKDGVELILKNMERLGVSGGAVYVDGKVVAFTLGSPINRDIFDIHIEKALPQYATAYTVINNEFAKTLGKYKFINREDDLGLEGLRKAKLSYKPHILLKKYLCISKKDRLKQIYNSAFGEDDNTFEEALFENCFKYCEYLEKDGRIVSMCFCLPCKIGDKEAKYIFAVTTPEEFRGNGYASELINKIKTESDCILVLRPVNESLIGFYKALGFCEFTATNTMGDFSLTPLDEFEELSKQYKETKGEFTAMYYSKEQEELDNIYFPYSMP